MFVSLLQGNSSAAQEIAAIRLPFITQVSVVGAAGAVTSWAGYSIGRVGFSVPKSRVRRMVIHRFSNTLAVSQDVTFTLFKNGTTTGLSVVVLSNAPFFQQAVLDLDVSFDLDDQMDWQATMPAGSTSGITSFEMTVLFQPVP